jgi:hypothetical protein
MDGSQHSGRAQLLKWLQSKSGRPSSTFKDVLGTQSASADGNTTPQRNISPNQTSGPGHILDNNSNHTSGNGLNPDMATGLGPRSVSAHGSLATSTSRKSRNGQPQQDTPPASTRTSGSGHAHHDVLDPPTVRSLQRAGLSYKRSPTKTDAIPNTLLAAYASLDTVHDSATPGRIEYLVNTCACHCLLLLSLLPQLAHN